MMGAKKIRQAWFTAPRTIELREVEIAPSPGQVLIETKVCGLCNWELNHWCGSLSAYPYTPGHELSGVIIGRGEGVSEQEWPDGTRVTGFGWGGYADAYVLDVAECFRLADHVPFEAALGEPLSCIVTTLRGAAPEAGDIAVVMGCGPMGLWCMQGLGSHLGERIAVDMDDSKLELAKRFGASRTINPAREDVAGVLAEVSGGHMADVVIEGTGVPAVLNQSATLLRKGRGRLILMSSHEAPCPEFDFRPLVERGAELRVTHPAYADDPVENLRRAVALLSAGVFRSEGLVTHRFPLESISEAFATLENKPSDYIKGILAW